MRKDRTAAVLLYAPIRPPRRLESLILAQTRAKNSARSSREFATDVALDIDGSILVTGETSSTDFAADNNSYHGGGQDVFVAKVSPAGTLLWSTYLGGSDVEDGLDIAVDAVGNALLTGRTRSTDFADAKNTYHGGDHDAFVAKVSPGGVVQWATFLGGSDYDEARNIALDAAGNALVAGPTSSTDFAWAINTSLGGGDAFVAKVSSDGEPLWATYLGGSDGDSGDRIVLDAAGNALLSGGTGSTDFAGAINTSHGGSDAFVAKVSSEGEPLWATYVGGSGYDSGDGIVLDAAGNALVAGGTFSPDFAGANNTYQGGYRDVFVLRLNPNAPIVSIDLQSDPVEGNPLTFAGMAFDEVDGDLSAWLDWTLDGVPVLQDSSVFTSAGLAAGVHTLQASVQDSDLITGSHTYRFTVVSYRSDDVPQTLKDAKGNRAGVTTSTLTVSDNVTIVDLDVHLDISHTRDADLDVFLIAPDGTRVELFSDVGGGSNNFSSTIVDDEATTAIIDGAAPFVGRYRPEELLSAFDNLTDASGVWTLELNDDARRETGTLNSWAITVERGAPPPPSISIDDVSVTEGDGGTVSAQFNVIRSGDASTTVTVDYVTADGTATAGSDYVAIPVTLLTFAEDVTSLPVIVTVNGDSVVEGDETFVVNLSNVSAGATITDSQGLGTIVDDDGAAAVTVSSINPNTMLAGSTTSVTIGGSGFAAGASVALVNGSGPAPTISNEVFVNTTTITAEFSHGGGGPKGCRKWDVVVTNPDGSFDALADGFGIEKQATCDMGGQSSNSSVNDSVISVYLDVGSEARSLDKSPNDSGDPAEPEAADVLYYPAVDMLMSESSSKTFDRGDQEATLSLEDAIDELLAADVQVLLSD